MIITAMTRAQSGVAFEIAGFGKENGWDALRAYLTKKSVIVRTAAGHDDWFKGSARYG